MYWSETQNLQSEFKCLLGRFILRKNHCALSKPVLGQKYYGKYGFKRVFEKLKVNHISCRISDASTFMYNKALIKEVVKALKSMNYQ